MAKDEAPRHLYSCNYSVRGYALTWCGAVVPSDLALMPYQLDKYMVCKRCCPDVKSLILWIDVGTRR